MRVIKLFFFWKLLPPAFPPPPLFAPSPPSPSVSASCHLGFCYSTPIIAVFCCLSVGYQCRGPPAASPRVRVFGMAKLGP
jgi:hypothetical protein